MSTSQQTFTLSNPTEDEPVPVGTLAYFQVRHRSRVYEMVIKEFLRSGITQATLARRMGKRPEQINRILGAPGNWTLDTISDLLFAISGAEPVYNPHYPLEDPPRNFTQPEWLMTGSASSAQAMQKYVFAKSGLTTATANSGVIPVFSGHLS